MIDWDQLIGRVLDEQIAREIVPLCVEDSRQRLDVLAEAIGRRDAEAVKSCAHAIKGSAANAGLTGLAEMASSLEQAAAKGELCDAPRLLEQITAELDSLRAFTGFHRAAGLAPARKESGSFWPTATTSRKQIGRARPPLWTGWTRASGLQALTAAPVPDCRLHIPGKIPVTASFAQTYNGLRLVGTFVLQHSGALINSDMGLRLSSSD